jgi:hypothetical protein
MRNRVLAASGVAVPCECDIKRMDNGPTSGSDAPAWEPDVPTRDVGPRVELHDAKAAAARVRGSDRINEEPNEYSHAAEIPSQTQTGG